MAVGPYKKMAVGLTLVRQLSIGLVTCTFRNTWTAPILYAVEI